MTEKSQNMPTAIERIKLIKAVEKRGLHLRDPITDMLRNMLTTPAADHDWSYFDRLQEILQKDIATQDKFDPVMAYRPLPTADDGLDKGNIKTPFTVWETGAKVSFTDELCEGGIAIIGGLGSGKSITAGHVLISLLIG